MSATRILISVLAILATINLFAQERGEPPVKAPFEKLDLYCVNDWWVNAAKMKNNPKRIIDVDVPRDEVICFGMYTVQNGVMKMTAQLFPLCPDESREVILELKMNNCCI